MFLCSSMSFFQRDAEDFDSPARTMNLNDEYIRKKDHRLADLQINRSQREELY